MIRSATTAFLLMLAVCLLGGCRSRPLDLYRPGETEVWRTAAVTQPAPAPPPATMTQPSTQPRPTVVLNTTKGDITIELYEQEAPITTENFLRYVGDGFFSGTIFHRVIPGFMIQGGGFSENMVQKTTRAPIRNEAGNGLRNQRGTLAMARTQVLDSATAQFFINVADNAFLNGDGVTGGYAVFGRVVEGMDVVDAIVAVETRSMGPHDDVPVTPVVILQARRTN